MHDPGLSAPGPPSAEDGLGSWLLARRPDGGLGAKSAAVVHTLATQPRTASFGGTAEVARLAGVNVATVTRTAQALGFAGWPALQREIRARYLSSLSAPEVAAEHGSLTEPGAASLRRDLDDLATLSRVLDAAALAAVVEVVATARRTAVLASGSYAAVGTALVHNARLAGYDVVLVSDASADLANTLAQLGDRDALVAISFWRLYASAVEATRLARDRGAAVCVLTDTATGPLAATADHVLVVPAEGVSFFPSLTPALAVVQALCAELAAVDPKRTRTSVEDSEAMWAALGVLQQAPRIRS